MGYILKAKCTNCDFEKEFSFGGNMMNFDRVQMVPALDMNTNRFVCVNYKESKDEPHYRFYTDRELKGYRSNENDYRNYRSFDLILNESRNYCPSCREFKLNFDVVALTD